LRTIHIQDRTIELALKELEDMIAKHIQDRTIELALKELEDMIANADLDIVNTTANFTMGDEDGVLVNTDSGNKTVWLTSSPEIGQRYIVGNRGSNQLVINGSGRKINGDATLTILYKNSTAQLIFNGIEWVVV